MRLFVVVAVIQFFSLHRLWAGPAALVIVDMQDHYVNRAGYQNLKKSFDKLATILAHQKRMIETAKKTNMPILIVQMKTRGPTTAALQSAIGDYENTKIVEKETNGLFDHPISAGPALEQLRKWGVKELVVMGANGGACVKQTILGAINNGYPVRAYTSGIADFNTSDFTYPYSYNEQIDDFSGYLPKGLRVGVISKSTLRPPTKLQTAAGRP